MRKNKILKVRISEQEYNKLQELRKTNIKIADHIRKYIDHLYNQVEPLL